VSLPLHRELLHKRRMIGFHFWAAGYCVSTVGLNEARVRLYIREQEELERRQGELDFEQPRTAPAGLPLILAPTGATTRKRPLGGLS
jgi:hypothetical protein